VRLGLPKSRDSANDRAPTIEEIKKLVEYPDRRIKVIASVMISSGIRLGAWDYFGWKNVIPILDEKGEITLQPYLEEKTWVLYPPSKLHLILAVPKKLCFLQKANLAARQLRHWP
jgi:hypothetical protein